MGDGREIDTYSDNPPNRKPIGACIKISDETRLTNPRGDGGDGLSAGRSRAPPPCDIPESIALSTEESLSVDCEPWSSSPLLFLLICRYKWV